MENKKISDLIKELEELKEKYGNIDCYNIEFYVEMTVKNEIYLTI
jgi:hypothetical protein